MDSANPAATAVDHDAYPDEYIKTILADVRTIAMVGASPNWNRPSNFAMKYLQAKGYKVYPVNPGVTGTTIHGETVYASVRDLPERPDMVDIFRLPWKVPPVVDDAIAVGAPYIWMQLKVVNEEAAAKAESAGATVIMDRCPAIELPRLRAAA